MMKWQDHGDNWMTDTFCIIRIKDDDWREKFKYLLTRIGGDVPTSHGLFDSLAAAQAAAENK
jgi:hypothetical protein